MDARLRLACASLRRPFGCALLATAAILTAACSSGNGSGTGAGGTSTSTTSSGTTSTSTSSGTGGTGGQMRGMDPPITVDLQGRTYDIYFPPNLDPTTPTPLFLELHGYVSPSDSLTPWLDEEAANNFKPEAAMRGIILVLPHATIDHTLNSFFWNATDSCCDFDKTGTNDIGYLAAVIQDVQKNGAAAAENLPTPVPSYTIDDKRIWVFGHSNGGFMANRVGCDMADKIAGIVSMAGETYKDQTKCAASAPIAFLEVQGDADMTVPYNGGRPEGISGIPIAPGAIETTRDWATKNDCNLKADDSEPPIQLMATSSGPDTNKSVYNGCQANGHTELWTIHLGPHSPPWDASWAPDVFDYVTAYPKP
jgi:polyhydroxybutyrate depolymerase